MNITALATLRWPALVAFLALTQVSGAALVAGQTSRAPHLPIPMSLLLEHAELATSLKAAAAEKGPAGDAAREVLALLEPHMIHEQELALAPLRLLPRLANREIGPEMADMIAVTDRLRLELPTLRSEHVAIKRALDELWTTSWAAGRADRAFLAQHVNRHIEVDEQVLYPAALVIGDYLRLALERRPPTE
jgi:hypothetical protein